MSVKISKTELKELSQFTADVATRAGGILTKGFNHVRKVTYKGRINPVTEWDNKAEAYITRRIGRAYPRHEILTEEGRDKKTASDYRWIIDPLDGTVNFAHGFPVYCVSVALEYQDEIVVGAVFDPERQELFWTARGMRSYLNRKPIVVSQEKRLDRALLATGFAYDIGTAKRNNLGLFSRMAKKAQGIRRPGSAAIDLCWMACGRIDGFWELKLHPWDTAAAKLIVENAGGRVSRIDGSRYSVFDDDILASNRRIHRAMQDVLLGR